MFNWSGDVTLGWVRNIGNFKQPRVGENGSNVISLDS